MTKPRKTKHFHLYKRVDIGQNGKKYIVFKCMKPACTHYLAFSMVEGKVAECNRCHNPMIMTKAAMELALPHCPECTEHKLPVNDINAFLEGKGLK